jgi:ABC-type xylose transport system permease subunit
VNRGLFWLGFFLVFLNLLDLIISFPHLDTLEGNPLLRGNPVGVLVGKAVLVPLMIFVLVYSLERERDVRFCFVVFTFLIVVYVWVVLCNLILLESIVL